MLVVTSLSGQTEAISKFNSFEMYEETNGAFTLSFVSFTNPNNPGHDLISEESIIEYEGYQFRVKQLRATSIYKNVSAISTYFDNADIWKYDIYGGTHTLDEFLTYVLAGTDWTYINEDINKYVLIPNFGNDNVVKLIDILKSAFECEMKIEPGNILRFANQLGPDNDAQYRYGHNILALSESIDTTKLKTYIEGFGGNGLHITYTSPFASSPGIGIRHAEPIIDDNYHSAYLLQQRIKSELHDYPDSTIELDAVELQDKEIGERVWLIHEKMGIEYQTRVMAKRTKIPKNLSSVVLGNRKPTTVGDLLSSQKVEIDQSRQEYRSKIKQTNDNITLEVSRLDGDMTTANSNIKLNADEIELKVSSTDYNGDTIVAKINLSSTTAKIEAANIDLVGQVSFSDLDSSVQSKIDAKADAISLGNIAYADMISQAMLDTTIIAGGYIKSSLLTASNIITGTLSADRIDTSGLYAERLYAPGYDANYMSLGSGSFFDLIMYQSNSEIFRIYDAGSSIVLMSHETPFLESGDGYTYAYNTWDFSNATVSGLKVVAVFG